jgi:hypothetical protein
MSKLTVIYLQATGHVLAAVTRAVPAETTEPITALIGPYLPVRSIGSDSQPVTLTFSADLLRAVTVNDQPNVVVNPQGFQVIQQDSAVQVTPVVAAGGLNTVLSPEGVTVGPVKPTPNNSLPVMVVLRKVATTPSVPTPTVLSSFIPALNDTVVLPIALAEKDTWVTLTLVSGYAPVANTNNTVSA